MEESISSSRTTTLRSKAPTATTSYHYHYHHQQPPAPTALPPQPPPAAAAAAAAANFEDDDDSGWTAYFLQLASDEEEDASASRKKKQLQDVGATIIPSGSASTTVSKPNKNKDKTKAVKKVLRKSKEVGTTRILEEEEDPLQDTASSPLLQLNTNGDLAYRTMEHMHACGKFGALLPGAGPVCDEHHNK